MKKLRALLVVSAFLTSLISGCHSPTQTEISTTLTGTTPLTPTQLTTTTLVQSTPAPITFAPAVVPTTDLTEANAADWSVSASDQQTSAVTDDFNSVKVGSASIKLETQSGNDVNLSYRLQNNSYWDLRGQEYLHFWLFTQNANIGFQNNSPWVILRCSDNSYIQYQTTADSLNNSRGTWQDYEIPLSGDDTWQTTNVGSANLAKITGLEIHADTWGYGFTMWVDGLCFEPYFLTTPSSTLAIITTPTTTSTSFFAVTTPTTPINITTTTVTTAAPPQPSTQVVLAEMFTGDW